MDVSKEVTPTSKTHGGLRAVSLCLVTVGGQGTRMTIPQMHGHLFRVRWTVSPYTEWQAGRALEFQVSGAHAFQP